MRVHVEARLRSAGLALRAVCCCMLGCCSVEAFRCSLLAFVLFLFLVSGESLQAGAGTDHNIVIGNKSSVQAGAGTDHTLVLPCL